MFDQNVLKQQLREVVDLGDIELSSIAGAIFSKLDEPPRLEYDSDRQPVLHVKMDEIPYQLARRNGRFVVHAEGMNMGELSPDSSLSDIRATLDHGLPCNAWLTPILCKFGGQQLPKVLSSSVTNERNSDLGGRLRASHQAGSELR